MSASPDLIFINGRIYTGDARRPWVDSLAVAGGTIIAIGAASDITALQTPSTRVVDLGGKLMLPAFCDLHTHFMLGSLGMGEVDLREVSGREEFRSVVAERVATLAPGEWLTGGYWNEEEWPDPAPDKSWLDDIAPDNPLLLWRHDLHQAVANSAALHIAGYSEKASDIIGGAFGIGPDGRPNGVLLEKAVTLVRAFMPAPDYAKRRGAILQGMALANSLGFTAVTDVIDCADDAACYFRMDREGELTLRVEVLPPLPDYRSYTKAGLVAGVGSGLVTYGPMKAFMDGSLGSRTALMFEPYTDDPGNTGTLLDMASPPEKLLDLMISADKNGFPVALHAIGDRAVDIALGLFEKVRKNSPFPHHRHRMEHAQHLLPRHLARFSELNVLASVQPYHLYYDGSMAEDAVGAERCDMTYAFKGLLDAGAGLAFGSDWPVVDLNPFKAIWSAVTRKTSDGKNPDGWVPVQKITVEQAVHAYTAVPAWARGKEQSLGRLLPGYQADMIVPDTDIFTCDPDAIGTTRVERTWLRGRMVYPEVE